MKFSKLFLFSVLLITPGSLLAQGLFQGTAIPVTVTATGQTEVIGPIIVSMTQGPASAGTLVIDPSPLQITNAAASDILVTPAGFTVGATTIDTTNNLVEIPVNASNNSTGSIRIDGIRLAIAGTKITSATAKLSWMTPGNDFIGGTVVPIINSVQSGLVAQPITNPFLIYNGQVVRSTSTIQLAEGYPGAFSNGAQYGQTNPTEVQITVTDFPTGIVMNFPASITANETGATLTTSGGGTADLTQNGTVTYFYSSAANSGSVAESFNINFSVTVVGPVTLLQPTIQVSLVPIGVATPNATFPATNIPRYAEDEILVQAGTSKIITKTLYWTGTNASTQTQLQMTNPASRVSNLTIEAFDANGNDISGTNVTNPVKLALPSHQALVKAVSDLFGTAAGISSIRIQSTTPDLLAVAVVTGNGADLSTPFVSQTVQSTAFPVVTENAQLQVMNPNSAAVTGTLTLYTSDGKLVSSAPVTLGAMGSTNLSIQTAFNTSIQSGYVSGVFSSPVAAFESFGSGSALNQVAVQPPASQGSLFIPFIAGGSSFSTDVNLINLSDQTVTIQANLFSGSGAQVGTAQPITMLPGDQLVSSVQQIFSQSPSTGYVRFDVPQLEKGFFSYYPVIAGIARIKSSAGGSTVVPLSAYTLADAFVLGDGTSAGGFEGIAFVNPASAPVNVTVQALNLDGSLAATATVPLSGGQISSQLTNQLFNGALPAQTVIRVTSTSPIAVTAISGTNALDQFRALPVLR